MNEFSIASEQLSDGARVVSVEGELDMASAPQFETELRDALNSETHRVVVDLSECDFLDSSTLAVLTRAHKELELPRGREPLNRAGQLVLVVPRPHLLKVFEITKLDHVFEIHATRAEALSATQNQGGSGAATGIDDSAGLSVER